MLSSNQPSWITACASFLLLIVLLGLSAPAAADDYVGGIPLATIQSGVVTGDLWLDATPAPDWGSQNVVKSFSLPDVAIGNITWARLYIAAYCGHMQNNYAFSITNRFDGNGDGTYDMTWVEPGTSSPSVTLPVSFGYRENGGNDNSAFAGHGTGEPYKMVNDHMNRVTSDYFMWYDVTGLIQENPVRVNVNTAGSFDGRIKIITLVVAYNDPASTEETHYWVNQGHDSCSYYTEDNYGEVAVGTTTFDVSGLAELSSATLTVNYMASNNGYYGFPTSDNNFEYTGGTPPVTGRFTNQELDRSADVQGAYSGVESWDVTDHLGHSDEVTLAYARYFPGTGTAAFFKIPLAILVAKTAGSIEAPVADFTVHPGSGIAPVEVSFSDTSSNGPTSWTWEYRETGTDTWTKFGNNAEVSNTFPAGTYDIRLTVTNGSGSDEETKIACINVSSVVERPVAEFANVTAREGEVPLTVTLSDESVGNITSWAWDFENDGIVDSNEQNPSHTYLITGQYTVNLTISGPDGSDSEIKEHYISVKPASTSLIAAFSSDPVSGTAPLNVRFTDESVGNITSWAWDFDNDGIVDSNEQNPTFTFLTPGQYIVNFTIMDLSAISTAFHVIQVTETTEISAPVAAFFATPISGKAPLTVRFSDNSTGNITGYAWDFNSDGSIDSTEKDPVFLYSTQGVYNVTLTVTGPGGSDSEVKPRYITATTSSSSNSVVAAFSATPVSGTAPLEVTFTDESKGSVTSHSWDFNDDGIADSTAEDPSFTFYDPGTYSVTLTVTGPGGPNSLKKTGLITVTDGESNCDLSIAGLPTPIGASVFAMEPNTVKIFKVTNNGPEPSPATEIELKSSDGFTGREEVPSLSAQEETTIVIIDTTIRSTVGVKVNYTATIDPDNLVGETNEGNNAKSRQVEVKYNGYKGAHFWGGKDDIRTVAVLDLHGDIIHSFGDSAYRSGSFGNGWNKYTVTWTGDQLDIPDNALIREARLYVPYCWDNSKVAPDKVSVEFNGKNVPYQHWYHDVSNFGAYWDHVYGLLTYNVTGQFKKNENNKVIFTRQGDPLFTKLSVYGFTLAVIYEDPDEPRRMIFMNEGFDLLGASEDEYGTTEEEATGYIRFSGPTIDTSDVRSAELITFVASGAAQEPGDEGEGNLIVNGKTVAKHVWDYGGSVGADTGEDGTPQVAVDTRDISDSIISTENEIGVQSTAGITPCMAPIQSFLIVTMDDDSNSGGSPSSGGGGYSWGGGSGSGAGGSSTLLSDNVTPSSANVSVDEQEKSSGLETSKPGSHETLSRETKTTIPDSISPSEEKDNFVSQEGDAEQGKERRSTPVFPLIIGTFFVSVGGASTVGLYYSIRDIRTKYFYLVAGVLLVIITTSLFGALSIAGGLSIPAAVSNADSPMTLTIRVMPVIEDIRDMDPGNDVPDYPENFAAKNGLLLIFEGEGEIRLDDLDITLGSGGQQLILSAATPYPAHHPSITTYLEEVGNGDGMLSGGEWLMVYADSCLINSSGEAVRWHISDTSTPLTVNRGDELSFVVRDRIHDKVIQEGRLVFSA